MFSFIIPKYLNELDNNFFFVCFIGAVCIK